jgi:chemotaxis protein histidine kinase CheA
VSTEADDPLAAKLAALRRDYLAEAGQRVAELQDLHARLAGGERGALDGLRRAFHRLAGSGGSYGFPEVSRVSREGEHLAHQVEGTEAGLGAAELKALGDCIDGVAAAFAAARATLGRERPS